MKRKDGLVTRKKIRNKLLYCLESPKVPNLPTPRRGLLKYTVLTKGKSHPESNK